MSGAVNEYAFVSNWVVEGTADEVWDILADPLELPRWWPSVYLSVRAIQNSGDAYDLHTRGWLPYTLRWQFRRVGANRPVSMRLEAWGDLTGHGEWTFTANGASEVHIRYDWRVRADKWILRNLSWLFKPAFAANHRWAMARGEESLRAELLRRRINVVAPPRPVQP